MSFQSKVRCAIAAFAVVAIFGATLSAQVIGTFPYNENFETAVGGTLPTGWVQSTADQLNWTADSGGTSSSGTGPAVDHNPGTAAGIYIYLETSTGALGNEAIAISPRFNYAALGAPVIQFWYHMLGATMGLMHVDLIEIYNTNTNGANTGTSFSSATSTFAASHVGGQIIINSGANAGTYMIAAVVNSTTVTLGVAPPSNLTAMDFDHVKITPDVVTPWTDNVDLWQERTISLLPSLTGGGTVQHFAFTIRGARGSSFTGDMAFDDVTVADGANDVGIVSLSSPVSGAGLGATEIVTVTLQNFGSNPQSNIPVTMILDGGAPVTEFFPGPLASTATAVFSFTATVDLSGPGPFSLEVKTELAGDQFTSNDGKTFNFFRPKSIPYFIDFESGPGDWTTYGTTTFALGTPANVVINSAYSGTNAWLTNLAGVHNNSENGGINGPAFDFSGLTDDPWVYLRIWWNAEFSWDGAVFQTSIDNGTSWQNVGAYLDPNNWYTDNTIDGNPGGQSSGWTGSVATTNSSNGWVLAFHELDGLAGQPSVLVRIGFGSDTSVTYDGVAFDDIFIGAQHDLQVLRGTNAIAFNGTDATGSLPTTPQQFTFTIENPGWEDLVLTGGTPVQVTPGAGSPSVTVSAQPALTTLVRGASTTFIVDFTPAQGAYDFTVSIANDVAGKDPFVFTVSGTGFNPNAQAQADPAPGSSFAGPTDGPFTMAVDPGAVLTNASILLTDTESDNISVASIVAVGNSPTGIVAPSVPGTPGHPVTLSWTGTADGSNPPGLYEWTVTFSDAVNGAMVPVTVQITINDLAPTHAIASALGGDGSAGNPYTGQFTQGDTGASTINLASVSDANTGQVLNVGTITPGGANPAGGVGFQFTLAGGFLTIAPAGTLAAADAGTHTFAVEVSDGTNVATINASILVFGASGNITFTTASPLPDGVTNAIYNQTIVVAGAVGAVTFNLQGGSLPSGLTLDASGAISGTPLAVGTATFTVQVVDSTNDTATQQYQITVNNPAPPPSDSGSSGGSGGSCSASAAGTAALASFAVLAGLALVPRRRRARG